MNAKDRLISYGRNLREIRLLREAIEGLSSQCEGTGAYNIDGMPRAKGSGGARDSQLAMLCDLKSEYEEKIERLSAESVDIERAISKISGLNHQEILVAEYIDGVFANTLPAHMRHSREWCRYTRRRAMREFERLYEEEISDRESVSQSPV